MRYVHEVEELLFTKKKLMDNDIFQVMVKNTVLLWLLQQCFCALMLKCNF